MPRSSARAHRTVIFLSANGHGERVGYPPSCSAHKTRPSRRGAAALLDEDHPLLGPSLVGLYYPLSLHLIFENHMIRLSQTASVFSSPHSRRALSIYKQILCLAPHLQTPRSPRVQAHDTTSYTSSTQELLSNESRHVFQSFEACPKHTLTEQGCWGSRWRWP
jgi:hypothetical protein